jgi:hypothetical protein
LRAARPKSRQPSAIPDRGRRPDAFVAETLAKKYDRVFQLCKNVYMRPAFDKPGGRNEYLIYCTFDRSEWWAFTVYTGMHEIIGPNNIYPDIPPPD